MSLESPLTYAEWYWGKGLDKDLARSESYEKTLAPIVSGLINSLPVIGEIPPYVATFLNAMKSPGSPDWDNVLIRFLGEVGAGLAQRVLGHELKDFDYKVNRYLQNALITPDVANILMQRKKISEELWIARQNAGGFSKVEGAFIYESQKPYPTIPEIITYARYHGDPDNPKDILYKFFDITEREYDLWDWLSWQKLSTEQVQTLYKRKVLDEFNASTELGRLGWHQVDRQNVLRLSYSIPNAMLLLQGRLQQEADLSVIIDDITRADIDPNYVSTYIDGVLTKPSTTDIIAYELRRDPSLSNLDKELHKIGIHSNYQNLFRELAHPIPPIADIITMAVREAFTPEIATRFGQYENLPPEFVSWVGKKGLTREWAERYWAAHWSLPSATQGFEMLHRGIITHDELVLLLRALDVMPFWRDKLIEMAYRPLNRIDIRRMYQLGVLSEAETTERYKYLGYNDKDARLMTEFTVKQVRFTLSRFTSNDIIRAYTKRFIDAGQARNLLHNIGTKDSEIDYIINTADYKREWAEKQVAISAIENMYKKGKYTEQQVRKELGRIGLPSDHVQLLIEHWQLKVKIEEPATWTATQTLSFLRKKLITSERATKEFIALGYDAEHINVYLASVIR